MDTFMIVDIGLGMGSRPFNITFALPDSSTLHIL